MSEIKGLSLEAAKAKGMPAPKASKPSGKGFPVTSKVPSVRPTKMKNRGPVKGSK